MSVEIDTVMAGADPAIEETTGYRWWVTPTAIKSMVIRCPGWLSLRARQCFADNLPGVAAEEIKRMANRSLIVDTIRNDTGFMATVIERYGGVEKHQYRVLNGRDGDRCVFVCCENTVSQQMVMKTILYYSSESVRSGSLPSRHLLAACRAVGGDRAR